MRPLRRRRRLRRTIRVVTIIRWRGRTPLPLLLPGRVVAVTALAAPETSRIVRHGHVNYFPLPKSGPAKATKPLIGQVSAHLRNWLNAQNAEAGPYGLRHGGDESKTCFGQLHFIFHDEA